MQIIKDMTVTALTLQTWFDISLQYTGSVMNSYAIALANNRSVTSEIIGGELLLIPEDLPFFNKEVLFFESKKIIPATGITQHDLEVLNPILGIGTMTIGTTFIVG
jgi:hypothetical protein